MRLTVTEEFPISSQRLIALQRSKEFVEFRSAVPGAVVEDVVISTAADSFSVSVRRSISTENFPASARTLVSSRLEVRQVEAWQAETPHRGTVVLEITGAPVRMRGTVEILPGSNGPDSALVAYEGEIKASVPLFGSSIERAAADAFRSALAAESERVLQWVQEREA